MEQKKKKRVLPILMAFIFVVGILLLLYPAIADFVNYIYAHRAISEYREQVETLDEDANADILAAAQAYNARLAASTPYVSELTDENREIYNSLLNITGSGIMGYIDIPEINVFLPIYHGTENSVLSMGVGHFEGSSLPVGGKSVHTVLTSHSGLPTARLFTDLEKLKEGDTFSIHVLNETIFYEVDLIEVLKPEELSGLHIDEGEDYCSLVTCTPYGVNTHRLVVRGRRVEPSKESMLLETEGTARKNAGWHAELLYVPIVVIFILLAILVLRKRRRKRC